jgi:hypothetical protein
MVASIQLSRPITLHQVCTATRKSRARAGRILWAHYFSELIRQGETWTQSLGGKVDLWMESNAARIIYRKESSFIGKESIYF